MNVKTILKYLFYGIGWGCTFFVVTNFVIILSKNGNFYLSPELFLKGGFASMLAGIGCAGGSIVYTLENWSWRKQVSIHFVVGFAFYFLAAYIAQWFEFSFNVKFLLTIMLSVAIFTVIWLVFYFINKQEEKAINEKLKEIQKENNVDD